MCHRDIKPSNVLIDDNNDNINENVGGVEQYNNGNKVKICDFGSAKQLKKG